MRTAVSEARWALRYLDGSADHWRRVLALRDRQLEPAWLGLLWRTVEIQRQERHAASRPWQLGSAARARHALDRKRSGQELFSWWLRELDDGAVLWLWARGFYARRRHAWDPGDGAGLRPWLHCSEYELRVSIPPAAGWRLADADGYSEGASDEDEEL